jgi:hypothetical protein
MVAIALIYAFNNTVATSPIIVSFMRSPPNLREKATRFGGDIRLLLH